MKRRHLNMSELNITGKMAKVITGLKLRTAQQHLADIRTMLGREKGQYISLIEFCKIKKIKKKYARVRLRKFGLLD